MNLVLYVKKKKKNIWISGKEKKLKVLNQKEMSKAENSSLALSSEEADHLIKSTKQQKSNGANFCPQHPIKSYRDSLTQLSPEWENHMQQNMHIHDDDAGSDLNEYLDDLYPIILLSNEEKQCTRAP